MKYVFGSTYIRTLRVRPPYSGLKSRVSHWNAVPVDCSGRHFVLSAFTAMTLSAPKVIWSVMSNPNGVTPYSYSPTWVPLTYTVAACRTPSNSSSTFCPCWLAGRVTCLRYQVTCIATADSPELVIQLSNESTSSYVCGTLTASQPESSKPTA